MKKMTKKFSILFFAMLMALPTFASSGLEEFYFQSGKIKVVITVAAIVLAGIFTFLFLLERRVKKLENKNLEK
jgi:hypothetical protein